MINLRDFLIDNKKTIKKVLLTTFLVILLIVALIVFLYVTTDMFKSDKTLFLKYVGKNVENLESTLNILRDDTRLLTNKYEEDAQYSVNYTKNVGTTSENADSMVNNLKFKIEGQTDKKNQYDHKKIELLNGDEKLTEAEYIQNGDKIGIKALGIVQYLYIENSNLKEFAKKVGISEEKFPDKIETDADLLNTLKFTEEQAKVEQEKYLKIIDKRFQKTDFEKGKRQQIKIVDEDVVANSYTLKTTKEQMYNMYLEILEELKQDEIILSKIDELQAYNEKINYIMDEESDLKTNYIEMIEKTIENINKTNTGKEELKITVYEYKGQTVRIELQIMDKEIIANCLQLVDNEKSEISILKDETSLKKISLVKNGQNLSIKIEDNESRKPIKIGIDRNTEKRETTTKQSTTIKYEQEKDIIEANINKTITFVESFENKVEFTRENSGQLDTLSDERLEKVVTTIKDEFNNQYNNIIEKIDIDELEDFLNAVGLKNTVKMLEGGGEVTEVQRNRFNSKFEFLQGKEIDGKRMLEEIEIFKNNIMDFNVVSNDVLKIEMNRTDSQDERLKYLQEFIRTRGSMKYNVTLEYDEETGLVKYIVMTIVRDKK